MTNRLGSAYARLMASAFLVAATLCGTLPAKAESRAEGSIIIRIDDGVGAGRCIAATDKLSVALRRLVIEKRSRWLGFIEDQELGLTFTTRLTGLAGAENKSASFAKVTKQSVQQFGSGAVSLAQEYALLSQFPLTTTENKYTVIDLEVGVVRTQGKSTAAKVLLGAISTTQGLALPANPFSAGFGVASTYVDGIFKPLLDSAAGEKEAVTHNIMMGISPSNCTGGDDERTGTKAIIDASDDYGKPGFIDTSKPDSYCFSAVLRPSFVLKFATKPSSGDCRQAINFRELQNSYMAFYVNALPAVAPNPVQGNTLATIAANPKSLELGGILKNMGMSASAATAFSKGLLARVDTDALSQALRIEDDAVAGYRDAIARCDANGIALTECIGQ